MRAGPVLGELDDAVGDFVGQSSGLPKHCPDHEDVDGRGDEGGVWVGGVRHGRAGILVCS